VTVVRFAPSPTGHLHLGGVRTALFNWLYGRQSGGTVRLRLEDTDQARSKDEFAASIVESVAWLGLDWDGEVVRQSDRQHLYRESLERLEAEGKVYRCYCAPAELDKAREMARAAGRTWRYPGHCRESDEGPAPEAPYVLRLRVPESGPPLVEDMILGSLHAASEHTDDFVLTRSDGTALYNFCCVVDDADMGVTHVVRGADHVENTIKQAALYDALGLPRPTTAHLPLVTGMSKRLGSQSVRSFDARGYLPETLLNYVARLGWSHGDKELFTLEELLELFRLEDVGRSPATVNPDKLTWLNEQHLKLASDDRLAALVSERLGGAPDPRLADVVGLLKPRAKTVVALAELAATYLAEDGVVPSDPEAVAEVLDETGRGRVQALAARLDALDAFDALAVEQVLTAYRQAEGLRLPEVAKPCRLALTGSVHGPKVVDIMAALGREAVLARLKRAAAGEVG